MPGAFAKTACRDARHDRSIGSTQVFDTIDFEIAAWALRSRLTVLFALVFINLRSPKKTLIEDVVVILKLSAVLQNQDHGKLQEQPRLFDECVLDLWETDTNQGQHDMDIAHKKFISTASNTPAIGVAAGSTALQVSAAPSKPPTRRKS